MKKKSNNEFISAWMDRCHELGLEVIELKNTLEYYYKLETKIRQPLEGEWVELEDFLKEKK